jgi:putative tricarboxylic transport membrane protein
MESRSMPALRPWWRDSELVFPLCLLVVTSVYLAASFDVSTAFDTGFVNSAFGPRVVAVVMYLALLFVLRDALRSRRARAAEAAGADAAGAEAQGEWAGPLQIVALTAVYIAAFRPLGYAISTLIYVYVLFYLFRFDEKSQLKRILYTVAVTAIFYVLFDAIFNVRLPKAGGIL